MIDNTRLPGDRRVAVVLNSFDEHSAQITVAGFPSAYASLKEKPFSRTWRISCSESRKQGNPKPARARSNNESRLYRWWGRFRKCGVIILNLNP